MSVAAMTMDERPLLTSYDKMQTKYEQTLHSGGGGGVLSGPASPTPSGSEEPTANQYHHHHNHHHQIQQQQQQQPQEQQQINPPSPTPQKTENVAVEQRQRQFEEEIAHLKLEQSRLTKQYADSQRREKILLRRLASKELEFQDYISQIAEYKAAQAPTALALRTALLDPAVNLLFEKLKKELKATKAKLEETQNELSAWKFTPDSNTGKRLMAKCRLLYQENEELGKMTSNGRLAKLENELAMQKAFSNDVIKSQSELDDFLQELDEDVEGMQSTILYLQQELKTTRDRIQVLEKENQQLKNGDNDNVGFENAVESPNNNATSPKPVDNLSEFPQQQNQPIPQYNGLNDEGDTAGALNREIKIEQDIENSPTNNNNNNNTSSNNSNNCNSNNSTTIKTTPLLNNEMNLRIIKTPLETIDENECLSSTPTTIKTEYYNGNEALDYSTTTTTQITPTTTAITSTSPTVLNDDPSNTNNLNALAKFRTAASRKRPYDDDTNDPIALAGATTVNVNVSSPSLQCVTSVIVQQSQQQHQRTLPPKKSKLRVTAAVRSDSNDLIDGDNFVQNYSVTSNEHPIMLTTNIDNNNGGNVCANVVEQLNVGGSVDENDTVIVDSSLSTAATETTVGVSQRIMTRRRSQRMQQNGGGGGNVGGVVVDGN